MTAFFTPSLKEGLQTIDGDEALHCSKVLRKKAGDPCLVFDGSEIYHVAELTNVTSKQCTFDIIKTETVLPQRYKLNVAISPTKNMQRFEWFLEKAIEMGIRKIWPMICERTERRKLNMHRCQKIIISAAKQSGNYHLPELGEMIGFKECLKIKQTSGNNPYIAYCSNALPYIKDLLDPMPKELNILIGPEGDFSEQEINLAKANGLKGLSLGKSRLRTETAGVFCCALMYNQNQI